MRGAGLRLGLYTIENGRFNALSDDEIVHVSFQFRLLANYELGWAG